jgi:hypothetical protein
MTLQAATEARYCESPPRPHGKPDWERRFLVGTNLLVRLCRAGDEPADVPSFTRCERCGGRIVRAMHRYLGERR